MKNNKGFISIFVILGIIIIGGAGVYFSTKKPNADVSVEKNEPLDVNTEDETAKSDTTPLSKSDKKTEDSKIKNLNQVTNVSCESGEVPLVQKGENVTKQTREDLDNDGIKELMVIYEKMVSGWEGMPMPSYRFTLFTCEGNKLVASYKVDSYSSNSFDFITHELGKAVFLGGYGEWYLVVKEGKEFEKLAPTNQRLQVMEKFGLVYNDGYHTVETVTNNKIEEILPGHAPGDALCCESKQKLKIVYEFKNNSFIVTSEEPITAWKKLAVNSLVFTYPEHWFCGRIDGNAQNQCENSIVDSHLYTFRLYPINKHPTSIKNVADSVSFLLIDPSDNQCVNWLKNNTFKHEGCISGGSGKNYAVYTDSDLQAVVEGFNLFLKTNKSPNSNWD